MQGTYLLVTELIAKNANIANRRLAGNDIQALDALVKIGDIIGASHLLPVASVVYQSVKVIRNPRIGIFTIRK